MAGKTVQISAEVPDDLFEALKSLAEKRGVSANTVLQQAIATEKYFDDQQEQGGSVLVEKSDKTIKRVVAKKR